MKKVLKNHNKLTSPILGKDTLLNVSEVGKKHLHHNTNLDWISQIDPLHDSEGTLHQLGCQKLNGNKPYPLLLSDRDLIRQSRGGSPLLQSEKKKAMQYFETMNEAVSCNCQG